MNYYDEIKNKIIDDEIYSKVKNYSKERHKVITYFEIGRLLNEAGGKYGDNIIEEYSKKLVIEVGKKYNRRTLYRMKQFFWFSIMKKCRHCRHNYLGVIIQNYCPLRIVIKCYII